jgi:hypothetical protein
MKTNLQKYCVLAFAAVCAVAAVALFFHENHKPKRQEIPRAVLEPLRVERRTGNQDMALLRPALRRMVDAATTPRERIDIAMSLDADLAELEIETLLGEVSAPSPDGGGLGVWHSQYFHEICGQLHRYDAIRGRFARVLAGVARDTERPRVERDYAIQHLRRVWYLAKNDPELRRSVLGSFHILANGDQVVAGPAILSLHFLGSDHDRPWHPSTAAVSNDAIEPLVAGILRQNPTTIETGTLMAAMRVAGDRKLPDPERRMEAIAGDISLASVVRMAAVAIIAKSAESPETFLLSIDRRDPRVDQAVRLSLRKPR